MARVSQSTDELQQHLEDQLEFLIEACAKFDAGHTNRFKQISTSLRILLHDTGSSKSLLGQLGHLEDRRWLDSAGPINPRNLMTTNNLVSIRVLVTEDGPAADYNPILGEWKHFYLGAPTSSGFPRMLHPSRWMRPFKQWWTDPVVNDNSELFSRRDLVLAVANTDGGAHVDSAIRDSYQRLSRANSLGFMVGSPDGDQAPLGSPVPASLRQIAFEALESLKDLIV